MLTREAIPQVLSRTSELLSADNLEGAPQKTFHHVIDIYLKDSNAFMNTYFARYFEWQGVCRERWFHECIHNNLLAAGGTFVTKRAHQEYVQETFPFQRVSHGYQQILFAGMDKRIRRFPEGIIERVKEYEVILPSVTN